MPADHDPRLWLTVVLKLMILIIVIRQSEPAIAKAAEANGQNRRPLSGLNWAGIIDPISYGVDYGGKSVQDLSLTRGSSSATSPSAHWTAVDRNKDLIVGGAAPAWQSSSHYSWNQLVYPQSNNPGGFVYIGVQGGTSGNTPPEFCQTTSGCTTRDGTVVWALLGTDYPVNVFTGCIRSVQSPTVITLGVWSGGKCITTAFRGPNQNDAHAYYQTDDTVAFQAALDSFKQGRGTPFRTSGRIVLSGWITVRSTLNITSSSTEIAGCGMLGVIDQPAGTPVTGCGIIWAGPRGLPMVEVQGTGVNLHDFDFYGNSNAGNQPESYIHLVQGTRLYPLGHYGITSFCTFRNLSDRGGGGVVGADYGAQAQAGIFFQPSTQTDRNIFDNVRFGNFSDECIAQLNQMSVELDFRNFTCIQTPQGLYMPNGGEVNFRMPEFNDVGREFLVGGGGRLIVSGINQQGSWQNPIPAQLLYVTRGGALVAFNDSGYGFYGANAFSNVPLSGHTAHDNAVIDADGRVGYISIRLNRFAFVQTTGNYTYRAGTPWRINLSDAALGGVSSVELTGSDVSGLANENLSLETSYANSTRFVCIDESATYIRSSSGTGAFHACYYRAGSKASPNLFEHDLGQTVNMFGGPLSVLQLQAPLSIYGLSRCASGPYDLYYRVAAVSGVGTSTPTISAIVPSCALPNAARPMRFAWEIANGADSYLIYFGKVVHGGGEPVEKVYDVVSATQLDKNGFLFAQPTQYTDAGMGAPTDPPDWDSSRAYRVSSFILPEARNATHSVFKTVVQGISGSSEPKWNSAPGIGETIRDNTLEWRNIGAQTYPTVNTTGTLSVGGTVTIGTYRVSGLPLCNSVRKGFLAEVSDCKTNCNTYQGTGFIGGGVMNELVKCNGSSWELH
jgi:hypothetical protein